ncbi:hypothetical protein [uncultured Cohaesibacter sp.]|uniref:hypothetical protein n=1 Tax=uncultured Cohaesibacter sp. TaxID=1002546 RepID=UPI002AA82E9D|nr:hypothetical protein [uncultured Cohaesibacter sp.]
MNYSDEFNIITKAQNERLRQQDIDDLNNELRGTNVGRMARFLSPEARDVVSGENKGKKEFSNLLHLTMLDTMLMDDEYRQLYDDAMDRLRVLEEATQRALDKAQIELEKSQEQLRETLERAAMLNGVHVFKDAQGRVWTEHDQRVEDSDADRIEWKGNEPSREEYHADRAKNHASQQSADDIRKYQTDTLGDARERLTDEDNPLTKDELGDLAESMNHRAEALGIVQPDAFDHEASNNDVDSQPKLIDLKL